MAEVTGTGRVKRGMAEMLKGGVIMDVVNVEQAKKVYGVEVALDDWRAEDALDAIADLALNRGTGARGLRAIMESALLGVMYDVPSRTDIAKVVIEKACIEDGAAPTLVNRTGDIPKRASRREKSSEEKSA